MHGFLPEEIIQVVRFGAEPLQALRAATSLGARAIGISSSRGTLEAGKRADIISLRGNPFRDIECVGALGCLFKAGVSYAELSGR